MTKRIKIDDLISSATMQAFIDKYTEDDKYTGDVKQILDKFGRKIISEYENRLYLQSRNIAEEVKEWVHSTPGIFYSTDVERFLHLSTLKEKKNLSTILSRLCEQGVIERHGQRRGCWRKLESEFDIMQWWKASGIPVNIKLPFELHKIAKVFPKSILVWAGVPEAGKTSAMLETVRLNIDKHEMYYHNSDSGEDEIFERMGKMDDIDLKDKKWKPIEQGGHLTMYESGGYHFADAIQPNAINLVDYLEEPEEGAYAIKDEINRIWNKLEDGIALIAIQKHSMKDVGYGGEATTRKARLYLAIDKGTIKIVKCKGGWKTTVRPDNHVMHFKLVQGWEYQYGDWHLPDYPMQCPECEKIEKKKKRTSNKWR